jgi:hypothetical protein
MNWKEFLKPTPLKIILFVLFPFFFAQTGYFICENIMAPCPQPFGFLPLIFAIFSYTTLNFNPIYITGAIPSYLLACVFAHYRNKKAEAGKRPVGITLLSVLMILLSVISLVISIVMAFSMMNSCGDCPRNVLNWIFVYPQIFFLAIGALGLVCSFLLMKMKKAGLWLSLITGIISIVIFYLTVFSSNLPELWFLAMVLWAFVIGDLWMKRKLFAKTGTKDKS